MQPDRTAVATVGDLLDLEGRLEPRMERMEARMERMEVRMDRMEARMEARMDRMEKRFVTVEDLVNMETRLEERLTRTLSAEIARSANVMMEHMTSLIRGAGEHTKAVEQRLDVHIADERVHVSAGRSGARRARGGGRPRS